ncbi:MAG: ribonuclease HII [Acidobacteria bacterium]|nr:ribonuclease HII [Acidobacteriota bacterium]
MHSLFDYQWKFPADDDFYREGHRLVAGVDEVGRGALAGPVVTAAVILDPGRPVEGIRDSKQLTPSRREVLAAEIVLRATAWSVDFAGNEEVDRLNVLEATRCSMTRAVGNCPVRPDVVLVDAVRLEGLSMPSFSMVRGDELSLNVAAASIVAKVTRDRWMTEVASQYPGYGFEVHKGYGTARHLAALKRLGPCPLHRRTFRPVAGMACYGSR